MEGFEGLELAMANVKKRSLSRKKPSTQVSIRTSIEVSVKTTEKLSRAVGNVLDGFGPLLTNLNKAIANFAHMTPYHYPPHPPNQLLLSS